MSLDEPQPITDDAGGGPDQGPTVGERLRAAREQQPLSLAQISAELRIETKYLTALEEDRLEAFPAPVFAKGFLRQYGGMLGLDERDLIAQYYRQAQTRDVPVIAHKPIRVRDEDQIRHWLAAAIVLVALAGAAAAWWLTQPGTEPVTVQSEPVPAPEPTPPAPAPALEMPAAAVMDAAPEPAGAAGESTEPAIAAAGAAGPAADEPTAADPSAVQVELVFNEDCWTEITDAGGERLFYGLGSAGARSRFEATLPISLFFGNAGGVELTVDGAPYPIPADSRQGNLARFAIASPED